MGGRIMKKSAFILSLLLLACDKSPEYQEIKFRNDCDDENKYGVMTLKISADDTVLNISGTDIKMTLTDTGINGRTERWIDWTGILPETNKEINISGRYNTETKAIEINSFGVSDAYYGGCSTSIVFYAELAGFNPPTESEKCIEEIHSLTATALNNVFTRKETKICDTRVDNDNCRPDYYYVMIDPADAVKISQNWNPEDFVEYSLDKDKEYKTEPCDALSNLKKYIEEHKSESEIVFYREDELCISDGHDIYFGCDIFDKNRKDFEYYKISYCNNGTQRLTEYHVLGNNVYDDINNLLSASQTENGILYSTVYEYPARRKDIFYNNNSVVLSYPYADRKPVVCTVGELKTHQLCARNIDKKVKQDPVAGTIEMEINYNYGSKTGEHETKTVTLSAEQALSVSSNWDYANGVKVYKYGTEAYESDACVVNERLDDMHRKIRALLEEKK